MFASSTSFSKKEFYLKELVFCGICGIFSSLVGLCDRSVDLNTKCALVKVSETFEELELLSQALVKIINTKTQNTCSVCLQKQ